MQFTGIVGAIAVDKPRAPGRYFAPSPPKGGEPSPRCPMHDDSFQQLQPGRLIAERYRLEEPIGQGAMGSVWRGVHVQLDSPVAIKLLKSAIAGDPEVLERFLREARSAAAVRSSHVVQIFDYGVDAGLPFIAMELLVGEPLDVRLDHRGVLSAPELDKVFSEVARAVAHAHAQGVVHRDIKPGNVFIALEGDREVTKVLDFGIAKLVDQRLDAPVGTGTHTGNILGTPSYMSPEQARGERQVDHRSDVWAMAVLAMECLTARHPFESETLGDLVVKVCTAQPLLPSTVASVPAGFDAWFARGISKDPNGRFQSVLEMADALHALLAAQGLAAESRPGSSRVRRISEPAAAATQPSFPHTMPTPMQGTHGPTSSEVLHSLEQARPTPMVAAASTRASAAPSRRGFAWAALLLAVVAVALALGPGQGLLSRAAEPETRAPSPAAPAAASSVEPAPAALALPRVDDSAPREPTPPLSAPSTPPAQPAAQVLAEPALPSPPAPATLPAATPRPAAKPQTRKRAAQHVAKPRTPRAKPRDTETAAPPAIDPYADRL